MKVYGALVVIELAGKHDRVWFWGTLVGMMDVKVFKHCRIDRMFMKAASTMESPTRESREVCSLLCLFSEEVGERFRDQ